MVRKRRWSGASCARGIANSRVRGETVQAWLESSRTRIGLSPWYVAFFHDRPGQPLASKCRHKDRYCQHISNIGNEDVREANKAELERLAPCGTCG
jgi:hypothetical protein